ncbi:hypothetical protein AAOE16_18095 [Ekhidna sp. MALMAid0563]|uniref:hypothetical protein n=1 Tax=Ekhidna sp. MALMAid0563 TaxID=3143937 RepID=UPI0032DEAF75
MAKKPEGTYQMPDLADPMDLITDRNTFIDYRLQIQNAQGKGEDLKLKKEILFENAMKEMKTGAAQTILKDYHEGCKKLLKSPAKLGEKAQLEFYKVTGPYRPPGGSRWHIAERVAKIESNNLDKGVDQFGRKEMSDKIKELNMKVDKLVEQKKELELTTKNLREKLTNVTEMYDNLTKNLETKHQLSKDYVAALSKERPDIKIGKSLGKGLTK